MLASRTWQTSERLVHVVDLLPLRSVRAFARDVTRLHGWRWLAIVWLVLRTVVGFVLEIVLTAVIAVVGLAGILTTLIGLLLGLLGRLARPLLDLFSAGLAWLTRRYADLLQLALGHSAIVIWLGVATLVATGWLGLGLDSELLPEVHQGEFTIEVQLPVGTPLEENEAVLEPVERAILAERDHIESLLVTYGFDPANSNRSDEGEHTARFKVVLDSSDPRLESTVVDRLRRRFADLPDVDARVVRPVLFSFRTPIEVEVHGENLVALRKMAERVRNVMAGLPALADVETTQRAGAPEVQVRYDRDQLARYGLNIQAVAQEVRAAVKGDEATLFNLGDRRVPIVARFAEDDRRRVENVREFVVNPAGARPISLGAIADIELAEGPSEVRRVDGRRVALVTANLGAGSLGEAVAELEAALERDIDWPVDMGFYVAGQSQEWQRSQMSLLLALGLSVFLVYVIMAAQFESLLQPLVIMLTIPLAFFGTVVALRMLPISLSVVVFLGMIMLAGIVVNNAIVLIDYINTLRRRGLDRIEAIVTAGTVRLRPILMTTATTVLGLLPMAFGLGDGAEIRTPMAITVISGLVASTVLTLVIIPSVYLLLDGLRERLLGPFVPGRELEDTR
jgi:HAE1 family hydrophobic/amphiphilic exporter-1